jgi:flagellar biosynthesis GTPase FlhF
MEEVRGEAKGKQYQGIIYFALDKNGEKTGNPFKSSLFGKNTGIAALEKRIEKSAEVIKDKKLKDRCKKVISAAMRTCKTRAEFEKALQKQGISVLFRTNDEGRIYGVTFIDHEQKFVFNGSRLGKEFSANVFNAMFNENNQEQEERRREENRQEQQEEQQEEQHEQREQEQEEQEQEEQHQEHEHQQEQNQSHPEQSSNFPENQYHEKENTSGSGIFDIFSSSGSTDDNIDDQALIRRRKKKKQYRPNS